MGSLLADWPVSIRFHEDPLTGLPDRRAYEEHLAALQGDGDCALLMIDVDDLRSVNASAGRAAADAGLVRLAAAITTVLRPSDFAARVGGDDFAVVLRDISPYDANCVAERIRAAIEGDDAELALTVSIGVAQLGRDVRGAQLAADQALYAAKRSGRNVVQPSGLALSEPGWRYSAESTSAAARSPLRTAPSM
jgi:diguanylate cyclase (GGDEF)-like protein